MVKFKGRKGETDLDCLNPEYEFSYQLEARRHPVQSDTPPNQKRLNLVSPCLTSPLRSRHSQGADMEVPLKTSVLLPGNVLRMFSPGAKTSILPEVG